MIPSPPAHPPLSAHMISTYYPHLGDHMGFRQVRKHFSPDRLRVREHLVTKDGEFLSAPFRAVRRITRNWFSQSPKVYMLEDWLAERALLREVRAGGVDIVQYLDAEHSLRHGPRWLAGLPKPPKVAGMFHMPPEIIERLIERENVRRLDAVITLAPDQADWFKTWLDPARVHLVKHGVDDAFFHPAEGGPPSEPPWRVVTVGTNFRDYDLLFRVAARLGDLPDVQFHVVKRFGPDTVIPSNVRVHTGLSDEDLAGLYRRSHICMLPLAKATASNTLLEGMASGLPVVVSDLYSVRSYAGEEEALFFPVGDAEAAAARIRELVENPELRLRLGRAGRARAERTNWKASAEGLTRIYESLAGRS